MFAGKSVTRFPGADYWTGDDADNAAAQIRRRPLDLESMAVRPIWSFVGTSEGTILPAAQLQTADPASPSTTPTGSDSTIPADSDSTSTTVPASSNGSFPAGAIARIVIGIVVLITIVVGGFCIVMRRKRKKQDTTESISDGGDGIEVVGPGQRTTDITKPKRNASELAATLVSAEKSATELDSEAAAAHMQPFCRTPTATELAASHERANIPEFATIRSLVELGLISNAQELTGAVTASELSSGYRGPPSTAPEFRIHDEKEVRAPPVDPSQGSMEQPAAQRSESESEDDLRRRHFELGNRRKRLMQLQENHKEQQCIKSQLAQVRNGR